MVKKCKLILKTEVVTDAGTDLDKVREYILGEDYLNTCIILENKFTEQQLNYLYNIADVQILLTSNEGWGLTLTEAMLAGTPYIANVTGGMQDQMRFVDNEGKWFEPDTNIPSNHKGTYKEHGEWVFPVYPSTRSIQGSPSTPYIFDDRCKWEDACDKIKEVYALSSEERKTRGLKGREWALSDEAGFTSEKMGYNVIDNLDKLFNTWNPREKYELIKIDARKPKHVPHTLEY